MRSCRMQCSLRLKVLAQWAHLYCRRGRPLRGTAIATARLDDINADGCEARFNRRYLGKRQGREERGACVKKCRRCGKGGSSFPKLVTAEDGLRGNGRAGLLSGSMDGSKHLSLGRTGVSVASVVTEPNQKKRELPSHRQTHSQESGEAI